MSQAGSLPAERARPGLFHADFVALLFVQMATGFAFATFFLLPKFMVEVLHARPSAIGLVSAGFGMAGIVAMPFTGRLLDTGGSRRAIIMGSGLMAVSALLFVTVSAANALPFALRFVQGIAVAMVVNGGSMIVAKGAPPGRLAESIGIFAAANLVMNAVAPVVAELIAERFGYTPTFVLAALCAGLAGLLALRVSPPEPPTLQRETGLSDMLRRPSTLRMAAILMLVGIGFGVMFTFGAPFAMTLGVQNVRGFFVAFACAAVVVRLFAGRAVDMLGYRRVSRIFLGLYGITVLAMSTLTPALLGPLGAAFGVAHGVFIPAFTALVVQDGEEHERGRILTLFNAFFGVGSAAVVGLGVCAEHVGYPALFLATGSLICIGPLLVRDSKPASSTANTPLSGYRSDQSKGVTAS